MKEKVIKVINKAFEKEGVRVLKIILFGSRARGDFSKDSDWDFLITVDKDLSFKDKHQIIIEIQRRLAKLRIPNDIIIKSQKQFEIMKEYPGNISFYANKEGITI